MVILFVAKSATLAKWANDVGLGKHLYLLGVAENSESLAETAKTGWCGVADWTVIAKAPSEGLSADEAVEKLQKNEKMIDPALYPRLKGQIGVFKVKLENVENHILVAKALAGQQTKDVKAKPGDIARYLLVKAQK